MSFTDGKSFVVSDDNVATFKRFKKRYHCSLCGHDFKVGDVVRWVYANGTPGTCGNFFVCQSCDGENTEVIQRGIESFNAAVKLARQWDIYGPDWERDR